MACTDTGLLNRKRQVLAKIETTCGTFEAVAAADGKLRVQVSPNVVPNVPLNERGIASASLSPFKDIPGELTATASFSSELTGSGSNTTEPEHDAFLQACGMGKLTLQSASIGAVTSGPFLAGEIVDDGSGNEAIALPAENGDATMFFAPLAGSTIADLDTLTGQTSGASATLSSTPAAAGFLYRPISSSFNAISIQCEEDGYTKKLKGCMGTFSISMEASQKAIISFEFQGAIESFADAAMTTGITYYTTIPPLMQGAQITFDDGEAGEYSPVLTSLGFALGNNVTIRRDGNATSGVKTAMITGRSATATLDPEMVLAATYDFHTKFFNGTSATLQCVLSNGTGNIVEIYAGTAQYANLGDGEREGISTLDTTMNLKRVGSGDDELLLVFK